MYSICEMDVSSETFDRVLNAVHTQDSQVLKPPLLKGLYLFLIYFSEPSQDCSNATSLDNVGIKIHKFNYTLKFSDVLNVSSFLFDELSKRFTQLFSDLFSSNKANVLSDLHSESWGSQKELILLLRCCMAMMPLLEADTSVLLEKCRVLMSILRKLCSREISFEHSNSSIPFLCSILEVFFDKLLLHRQLRVCFIVVDNVCFTNNKFFKCHSSCSDAVLEVICAHFILSVNDEYLQKKFLEVSDLRYCKKASYIELSLPAALQLLESPIIVSAPLPFQAYTILIVVRCIGTDMASEDREVNARFKGHYISRFKGYYISAFKKALSFYARHVSCLHLCDYHLSTDSGSNYCDKPFRSGQENCPSFESYIWPVTYNGITQVASFGDYKPSFFFKNKSELWKASISYIKENEQILNQSCKDEILSVLDSLVLFTLSAKVEDSLLHTGRDASHQEIFLLVSIINLVSHSLLQLVECMNGGSLGCQKSVKDYDVIINIIGSFLQCFESDLTLNLLDEVMGSNSTSHKESKLILMHFAGLLLFCYEKEHDNLWKACISMMMTLMNLISFEEDHLESLNVLLSRRKKSRSGTKYLKAQTVRKSSLKVASEYLKIQKRHIRRDGQSETSAAPLLLKAAEEEEICNGEVYFRLYGSTQSDIDELADFVECKKGKDYAKWWKDKESYRAFSYMKTAARKRERRKKERKSAMVKQSRKA
ncbi:2-isopropylmalate synthase [Thalictrum thalictroides]|uniref:2-isopropylmalate synthase n=1 Tax=Thalictrum thalictroides TaxID=46969 RepID=A0A7J6VHP3_THATH|nr:2-isopropylmalate synthase [Thalictrum thalictroides]